MKSSRVRHARATVYVSAAALAAVLAVPAVASATVTATTVDAPAPEAVLEGNQFVFGAPSSGGSAVSIPISGTAPGADAGDLVDLVCTVIIDGEASGFPLATNVPVGNDGRFTGDAAIPPYTCRIRALPAGLVEGPLGDRDLDAFAGPRVLGGSYSLISALLGSRAAVQQPDSYFASRGQRKGFSLALGVGAGTSLGGGPFGGGSGVLTTGLVDDTTLRPVLGGVGMLAFFGSAPSLRAADPAGTPIVVDGRPATAGLEVGDEVSRVISHDLDPVTGDLRIVESAPVGAIPDDPGDDLEPTGITLERTFVQDHDGRLFTFHDVLRSTDGAAHQVEVRYSEGGGEFALDEQSAPTYRVPWKTGDAYVEPMEDDADFGPAPAGRATIYVRSPRDLAPAPTRAARAAAPQADQGAYDFDSAPSDGRFTDGRSFTVRFVRDVPAAGSATVSHRYAQAPTLSELDELLNGAKPAPGGVAPPLPANTPLPTASPVLPLVTIPGVVNPLPRVASSAKKLLLTRAEGAKLRDRKPVTVRVKGVPAGRYGITVQRFVRNGKVLARGTTTLAKDGDLAVTLRLTAYGRHYLGQKRSRERASVRTLVKVTWTPPGKGRKSRTGVFTTRFR